MPIQSAKAELLLVTSSEKILNWKVVLVILDLEIRRPKMSEGLLIYNEELLKIEKFLQEEKYRKILSNLASRKVEEILIQLDDVFCYDENLCTLIESNTKRYHKMFERAIDKFVLENLYLENCLAPLELFIKHQILSGFKLESENANSRHTIPSELIRKYEIFFENRSTCNLIKIKDVNQNYLGKLVKVRGIVTKASTINPIIQVATYVCFDCSSTVYQPIHSLSYKPLSTQCPSTQCNTNKTKGMNVKIIEIFKY